MVYTDGLTGWWKCYGDSLDSVGSNDLTNINAAPLALDRLGDANKAYSFNGTTQYLVNTTMDTGVFNDEFTVSATFRADSIPTDRRIVSHNSSFQLIASSSNNRYYLRLYGTTGNTFFSLSDTFFPNLRNNQWVTLTVSVSKSGDFVKSYINGVLHKTTALSAARTDMPAAADTTMYVGRYSSGQYWDGKINNVMLWDKAITDSDALEVFNIDKPNGLVHTWRMDGDATDSVGIWNGTAFGPGLTTDEYNNIDHAYEYDGTAAEYLRFYQNAFYINSSMDYTVSSVIYWAGATGVPGKNYQAIWQNGTGSYDRNGCKVTEGGNVNWQSYDGSYDGIYALGSTLVAGNWYSIICRQLNGVKTLFVNGVAHTTSANTYELSPPGEFRLSRSGITGTNGYGSFNGKIATTMIWDTGLSDTEVVAVSAMGNPVTNDSTYSMFGARASTLNDGIKAAYKFEGDATDSAGSHDGTVSGLTLATDRFDNLNSGYENSSDNNRITINYGEVTGEFTFSVWLNINSYSAYGASNGNNGLIGDAAVVNDGGRISFQGATGGAVGFTVLGGNVTNITLTETMPTNEWYMLTVTRDSAGNLKVYKNSVDVTSGTPGRTGTINFEILFDNPTNSSWRALSGVGDDVFIWERVVTSDERKALYNARNPILSSGAFPVFGTEVVNDDFAGCTIDKNAIYTEYLSEAEVSGLYSGGRGVIYEDMDLRGKLVFKGKIDNAYYGVNQDDGFYIDLSGREYPQMIDRTIVGTHTSALCSESVGDVLSRYFPDVKLSFWTGTAWSVATYDSGTGNVTWSVPVPTFPTELINYSYEHNKSWSVIKELFGRVDLEFYIDYSKEDTQWYLRSFVPETYFQSNDVIVYGDNLISMTEYGRDTTELVNRVIAYGKIESDNILLLKTEEDDVSQSSLWVKDAIVRDESLANMEEIQEKADFELSEGLDVPNNGRMTVVGLSRVKPGAMITATVPYTGIEGRHKIQSFTHQISGNKFTTNVELTKRIRTIKDIFIEKVNPDDFTTGFSNINDMQDSYSVYFDEDPSVMMFSSTEESSGRLQLQGTQVSGNAYATYKPTDRQVRFAELRKYQSYSVVTDFYDVTNDGGNTWETYSTAANAVHEFATAGGTVSFRINMSRSSSTAVTPQYESVALLYKE